MSRIYLVDTGMVHERYSQAVGKYYSAEDIHKCPSVPGPTETEEEARLIMDSLFDSDGSYDVLELIKRFVENTKDDMEKSETEHRNTLIETIKKQNDIWNKVREMQIMLEYPKPIPPDGYLYVMKEVIDAYQKLNEAKNKEEKNER